MHGVRLEDVIAIAAEVGLRLGRLGLRCAVGESCTGGLVAYALTAHPGSSAYFAGGGVVYSNASKQSVLHVDEAILAEHGAVSEEVAAALAYGACKQFGADVALATTGIAGPSGGTEAKPVGLVWMAVAWCGGDVRTESVHFGGNREKVRFAAGKKVLEMLYEELSKA